jgi:hypothetical protein
MTHPAIPCYCNGVTAFGNAAHFRTLFRTPTETMWDHGIRNVSHGSHRLTFRFFGPLSIPFRDRHIHARADFTVFNVFNHSNPRDVQSIADSPRYSQFFNDAWREYRGKFVFEF